VRFEEYVPTVDRWYDIHATRVGDGPRVALLVDDITDRKRAEAAVRESRATLEAAVEAADLGVWELDLATDSSSVRSVRHDQMFGYAEPQTEWGRAIAERHVVEEDRPVFRAAFSRALETGILAFDARVRWADGSIHWIAPRGRTFYDASGHAVRMAGVVAEVTDRKQAEAEREDLLAIAERARAEAERANEAKDAFLAVLSHELRAPMNAMLGWLRILKSADPNDTALVTRALDTLERNVGVQAQVINDLLDVSRIMSGKLEIETTRLDLAPIVTDCVESLRPSAAGKRIRLSLRLARRDLEVVGDGARLQQVVSNLVGNAIKFTEPGGRVTVTVSATDGLATIVVRDTGQGITPEFLPHIFERFSQGDVSTARRHGGLGLGLAIVKNLVALHGGEVRAASTGVGHGARFTVTLPLATKHAQAPARRPEPPTAPAASLAGTDVLIVEDDDDWRHALELALAARGARVRAVPSAAAALAAWRSRPPDVLVSDIGMPGEDGYALIRTIREREDGRRHRTLAIAVTGFAGRDDRQMALRAGFDEHLAKPVEIDALLDRIRVLAVGRAASPAPLGPRVRPVPPARPPASARRRKR
jgi:PAS domain S-box-containing protein